MRWLGPRLKSSQVARRNLRSAFPDMSPDRIEAIVAEVWDNLGRVAAEFPHIHWLINNRVEVENLHYLHDLRDDGQPGLFISAHFGNWEVAGAILRAPNLRGRLRRRAGRRDSRASASSWSSCCWRLLR